MANMSPGPEWEGGCANMQDFLAYKLYSTLLLYIFVRHGTFPTIEAGLIF